MSVAVLGILIAVISLNLPAPGLRIGVGVISLLLFLLFVFYARKRTGVKWQRLATALSGATAALGVWAIVISIVNITQMGI